MATWLCSLYCVPRGCAVYIVCHVVVSLCCMADVEWALAKQVRSTHGHVVVLFMLCDKWPRGCAVYVV
jgi:hypothetical protein